MLKILIFLRVFHGFGLAVADESPVLDESIERLLSIPLFSATKAEMESQLAPGSVMVLTESDIRRYGFQSLKDILAQAAGIQINEYRSGHQLIWIRGVQQRYNDKILLLIDGVPLRDAYYGHFDVDQMIPIYIIDRVEILRGPGSVLYGANAFAGVINVKTKRSGTSVAAKYGTFKTMEGAAELGVGDFYGTADYYRSDGFSPPLNEDGKPWTHPQGHRRAYSLLKYENGDLQVTGSFIDYDYPQAYTAEKKDYSYERKPKYLGANYEHSFEGVGRVHLSGYYELYDFTRFKLKYKDIGNLKESVVERYDSGIAGLEGDLSRRFGDHSLTLGLSYQRDWARNPTTQVIAPTAKDPAPGLSDPNVGRDDSAIFLQDVWSLVDHSVLLTSGLRHDFLSDFDDISSYRLGLTGESGPNYAKLLWGTAFRVPSYREYLHAVAYNPALTHEHLQTFEAQVGHRWTTGEINLTFFHNTYKDFIQELNVKEITTATGTRAIDDEYYVNAKRNTISGLELNSQATPIADLSILFGMSYILRARGEIGALDPSIVLSKPIDLTEHDLYYLSRFTANAAISYRLAERYRFGLNGIYYSKRKTPPDYQSAVPDAARSLENANGFVKFDFSTSIEVTKSLSLGLNIDNLFDKKIFSPPFFSDYDIEWPGRQTRVWMRYSF